MKINKEEATKLYMDGLLDTEIAKRLNCSKATIQKWRQRNNLKSNYVIAMNEKNLVNHEQITKLWENGLKDSEIAKELKCAVVTVWTFRKENGMGSNVGLFTWDKEKESRGKVEGK
jgi:uncharacterized protein YjcR